MGKPRLINVDNAIKELEELAEHSFVMTDKQVKFFLANQPTIDTVNQEDYQKLLEFAEDMASFFPSCIDCEGKTPIGERTDKCVYAKLSLTDEERVYCVKRGIKNILKIQDENRLLKTTTVSKAAFEQVAWERDTAIRQLESYGVNFGEKADVQRVRYGEWENHSGYDDWYCSECGFEINYDGDYPTEYDNFKFCGCCGAKMDKE